MRRVRRYAARFDALDGRVRESAADAIAAGAADGAARRAGRASAPPARHIARVARAQVPRSVRVTVAPGVSVEQRVRPLDRVGCYVPGGRYPLPSSLLMTAIPARVAGVREIVAVCPRPEPWCWRPRTRPASRGCSASAARTRSRRSRTARRRSRAWTRSSAPATSTWRPRRRYVARDCAIDFQAGPERDPDPRRRRATRRGSRPT